MGLKTFMSAAFSAGTLAANTISEGINAISGVTTVLGEAVQDFQKASAYEREKENALERAKADIYYAKQFLELKKQMRDLGITDLSQARTFFERMKEQIKKEENDLNLDNINLN